MNSPVPVSNMSVEELIREADHTNNTLALRLIDCFEEATDLETELADKLTRGYENLKESLQGLTVVVTEEVFNVRDVTDLITEAIAIECDDEGLPEGLAEAIEAIIKRERAMFEELVAEAWPKWMFNEREHDALNKEVKASTACVDVPEGTDFDNPFPEVLEAKRVKAEEEKARYAAMRKEAAAQKVVNRKSKAKPKGKLNHE